MDVNKIDNTTELIMNGAMIIYWCSVLACNWIYFLIAAGIALIIFVVYKVRKTTEGCIFALGLLDIVVGICEISSDKSHVVTWGIFAILIVGARAGYALRKDDEKRMRREGK